jgi:hypothetical protein
MEVTEAWRTLRRNQPHNLCYSPNIIRVNEQKRTRLATPVYHKEELRYRVIVDISLYICVLFNDTVSSSDCVASNCRMIYG